MISTTYWIRIIMETIVPYQLKVLTKLLFARVLEHFELFRHGCKVHRIFDDCAGDNK